VRASTALDQPEQIVLLAQAEQEEHTFPITDNAAQKLWAQLTQVLYPQAAANLTGRIETVASQQRVPAGVTNNIRLTYKPDEGMIEVGGVNRDGAWTMDFSLDEGHSLWTSLEDILHNISQRRGDSQVSS